MDVKKIFNELILEIKEIASSPLDKKSKLEKICDLMRKRIYYYNWVGFYFAENGNLILKAYSGDETEHKVIPFGKGVCGRVAETKSKLVVQDVSKEENYLSCSRKVKAEIVIPIIKNDKFVGEIDIDSHYLSPFSKEDEEFLEKVCKIVEEII